MLPINTLREIQKLFPTHSARLDEWQTGFVRDQLQRLEKWNDEIRLSEKQGAALQKILGTLQKADAEAAGGEQA